MIAEVIIDISNSNVDRVYDYYAEEWVTVGSRVFVPFGRRKIEGIVIALKNTTNHKGELKSIIRPLDSYEAVVPELIDLMWYMKSKYNLRLADILHLFIPSVMRNGGGNELKRIYASLNLEIDIEEMKQSIRANSVKQLDLIAHLTSGGEFLNILNKKFGEYSVNALRKKGYINTIENRIQRIPYKNIEPNVKEVTLTLEQQKSEQDIMKGMHTEYLLHGVTGSGKTEIYLNIIKQYLDLGKTAIFLVPEISLTPQMLAYLRGRFGEAVAILHSGLSIGEKYDEWCRIRTGVARVIVGARSAIYAPIEDIGVIILDEEHEQSYISDNNPRYNTHEIAKFRADYNNAKVILGSATPSIDSYTRALNNEIQLVNLSTRYKAGMPKINIINMSNEIKLGNKDIFSLVFKENLANTIENGKQVMIFINRRGYASFVMCKECGHVLKCEDCDVSLTYHREDNSLKCHYCNNRYRMITNCPECGSDKLRNGRVGTEQVVNELHKLFPNVEVLRMDNDTTRTKTAYVDILTAFRDRKAQILVGTQMIAKGHDFPNVTLVGILDADLSLHFSDYLSSERTFQLITQVAGRAGRGKSAGQVFLQTYCPNHYVFKYAVDYNYKGFYDKEANTRKVTSFPPFTKIIRIMVSGELEEEVTSVIKSYLPPLNTLKSENEKDFVYMQAMHSPIKRLENKYRYQIIIRIKREHEDEIISKIYAIINANSSKRVNIFCDINPRN